MDPLSIAASVVAIIDLNRSIIRRLAGLEQQHPSSLTDPIRKFRLTTSLLEAICRNVSKSFVVEGLEVYINLCYIALAETQELLDKSKGTKGKLKLALLPMEAERLAHSIGNFCTTVTLLDRMFQQ